MLLSRISFKYTNLLLIGAVIFVIGLYFTMPVSMALAKTKPKKVKVTELFTKNTTAIKQVDVLTEVPVADLPSIKTPVIPNLQTTPGTNNNSSLSQQPTDGQNSQTSAAVNTPDTITQTDQNSGVSPTLGNEAQIPQQDVTPVVIPADPATLPAATTQIPIPKRASVASATKKNTEQVAFNFSLPKIAPGVINSPLPAFPLMSMWQPFMTTSPYTFEQLSSKQTLFFNLAGLIFLLLGMLFIFKKTRELPVAKNTVQSTVKPLTELSH